MVTCDFCKQEIDPSKDLVNKLVILGVEAPLIAFDYHKECALTVCEQVAKIAGGRPDVTGVTGNTGAP